MFVFVLLFRGEALDDVTQPLNAAPVRPPTNSLGRLTADKNQRVRRSTLVARLVDPK